jgi:ferrochelatase
VALIAPSFVADCLETLEELDEELRVTFLQSGGDALLRVPSLNAHPAWIRGAAELICRPLPQ